TGRADQRDVGGADPEFVKPVREELIVFEGEDPQVLEVLPDLAVEHDALAAEERAVLEIADAAQRGAGADALLGPRPRALRRQQCRTLAPPDVVPLNPAADVQRKVFLRRTNNDAILPRR